MRAHELRLQIHTVHIHNDMQRSRTVCARPNRSNAALKTSNSKPKTMTSCKVLLFSYFAHLIKQKEHNQYTRVVKLSHFLIPSLVQN